MLKFKIRPITKTGWFVTTKYSEELLHSCPWCGKLVYYELPANYVICPFCKKVVSVGILVQELSRRIEYHKGEYLDANKA
jgi:acetyl-CoA carboxylase beta subunit